ncbi:hypothetical protein JTB14_010868 [Gonioctena quinquepunctata]|nr:hypothetical protein JTB14_010868 [Gonioctena quinquepunctata]
MNQEVTLKMKIHLMNAPTAMDHTNPIIEVAPIFQKLRMSKHLPQEDLLSLADLKRLKMMENSPLNEIVSALEELKTFLKQRPILANFISLKNITGSAGLPAERN